MLQGGVWISACFTWAVNFLQNHNITPKLQYLLTYYVSKHRECRLCPMCPNYLTISLTFAKVGVMNKIFGRINDEFVIITDSPTYNEINSSGNLCLAYRGPVLLIFLFADTNGPVLHNYWARFEPKYTYSLVNSIKMM